MNEEYIINKEKVLVINNEILDPNGNPLIVEISLEEYKKIVLEVN